MSFQSQYARYQQAGYVGGLARPGTPFAYEIGEAGQELQPGWGVMYSATNDDWRIPTSAATRLGVLGIVSFDPASLSSTLDSIPSGANSDQVIKIADGREVRIGVQGVFWARAGEAMEYGDLVVFDHGTDKDWLKLTTPTTVAGLPRRAVVVVSPVPVVSGALVELSFGSGLTK